MIFTVVKECERKVSAFNCFANFVCSESFDASVALHQLITS